MKVVLQMVSRAGVPVGGEVVGAVGKGFSLLLGVVDSGTIQMADKMVDKVRRLRIFHDENGKTSPSLADVGGELLAVSQFTLYADCKKGDRPSFIRAEELGKVEQFYEHVTEWYRMYVPEVGHGVFGAGMKMELVNDRLFTLALDSEELGLQ